MDWLSDIPTSIHVGVFVLLVAGYLLGSKIPEKRKYARLRSEYASSREASEDYAKLTARGFDCKLKTARAFPRFSGGYIGGSAHTLFVKKEQFGEAMSVLENDNQKEGEKSE